ncbi:MAG: acyltransferase family protein, partial [Alphaproteobacteria bacterium]
MTHLYVDKWLIAHGYLTKSWIVAINGDAGVAAFFVLSGFLITYLLVGEQEQSRAIDIRQFFIRRALRIVPVYTLFLVAATLLAVSLRTSINGTSLLYAALYLYNFIPRADYSSIMGHTWSLAVEWHFYLVWPFVFYWLRRNTRWLFIALLAAIALAGWFLAILPSDQSLNEA